MKLKEFIDREFEDLVYVIDDIKTYAVRERLILNKIKKYIEETKNNILSVVK